MKVLSKYLPKNHNEFTIFCFIVVFIFSFPLISNVIQTGYKLNQLDNEFIDNNPEMEKIIIKFNKCFIIKKNNEQEVNEKCLTDFRKSTTDEQNYKLANYYDKKKEILLQAKKNLN